MRIEQWGVKLASMLFQIDVFGCNMFGIYDYRLDSYRVESESQCLITVRNSICENDSEISYEKIVAEEITGFFLHRVYSTLDGGTVWDFIRRKSNYSYLRFYVNAAWNEIILIYDRTNTNGQCAFEYLGKIIPSVMLAGNQVINFHGVLMEHQGEGIIISAASGTGKTTHARMWRDIHNALIINGDRAACSKVEGAWTGFGLPWSGSSGEQINRSVPIKVLVVLARGEENYTERLTGLDAFTEVLPHLLYPRWDAELTGKAMDLIDDFLSEIPVVKLYCRPDYEAVEVLKTALENL